MWEVPFGPQKSDMRVLRTDEAPVPRFIFNKTIEVTLSLLLKCVAAIVLLCKRSGNTEKLLMSGRGWRGRGLLDSPRLAVPALALTRPELSHKG
jgi:hypothetical protein